METSSKHLSDDNKEHHDNKRVKLDRSRLDSDLAQPSPVSNGVKNEIKVLREEKPQVGLDNVLRISPQKESAQSQEKPSLKRPAPSDDSDDDATLGARAKQMLTSNSNSPSNRLEKSKSVKDSPSKNDIKKIKKIKPDGNSSASPKVDRVKKPENSDGVKKLKTESSSTTPNQADGVKKSKSESGSAKTDGIKKLKVDSGSPRTEGVKKSKSDSNTTSKTEGIKKIKSESGISSPSKSSESIKNFKQEGSSAVKSDGAKKIKHEGSVKIKSEIKKEEKEKQTSSSTRAKEGSSIKTDKDKSKTTSSGKTDGQKNKECSRLNSLNIDGIKKEKQKTSSSSSSKPENTPKSSDSTKQNKDSSGLTSPKVDGIKKEKHRSSSPVSSKPEGKVNGIKKEKQMVASSGSPKVDGVKKIKTEPGCSVSSSGGKKVGEKKIKAETSSELAKSEKKIKSESSSSSGKPKVKVEPGVKKVKTESGSSSSSKVSSGTETAKTSTDDSDDDVPLAARSKMKTESSPKKVTLSKDRKRKGSDDDDDDYKPLKKIKKKSDVGGKDLKKEKVKKEKGDNKTAEKGKEGKGKEKKEEQVWKWWEEEKHPEGIKWLTLEHKGPYFPPEYEPLPDSVNFYYDGNKVELSPKSEEIAGFYAKMLDHDYTSKKIFNDNFFQDWRKEMTDGERAFITKLSKCDFKEMHAYYVQKNEERKNKSKEEKQKLKEKNEEILEEYGYCMMDNHRERVGNFKIEPPGLFRGRGDHPKQGKLKKRLQAKDVTINIGKDAKVPDPPEGQRWKAVQHDNKVTWLACWIENIQGSYKYVMLNPTSRIKGEKDWQKYETARKLKGQIQKIREDYTNDWRAKEMRIRQRGVALYFIDKLALRAGHEKDEDTADTVGCCSLRYEHIKLHRKLGEKECVVEFDFLGKDSIHYHNFVEVEKKVFKNLELFQQGKSEGDDLFDRLSTTSLNKYLSELMEGLSAKVFRTYNASMTLQEQLNNLELEDNVAAKVLGYNRANRAVAILCNHQRSVPKTFEQSMSNLQQKIDDKRKAIKDAKNELKDMKHEVKDSQSVTLAKKIEKKKTAIERLKEQLFKLEVSQTDKNENKEIALGTSKLNYLDPRISIAWCLKNVVPIEKIYNKTQRQKFAWAIDMTEEDFVF